MAIQMFSLGNQSRVINVVYPSGVGGGEEVLGIVPEYQAILDYADANVIDTPSDTQNAINNAIVKNLVIEGVWAELDLFYYFKQEAGLEDFTKLNWKSPGDYTLTDQGAANVEYVADTGYRVTSGSTQGFNTSYNPSTDAVKFAVSDYGIMWKTFDIEATVQETRWFGGTSASGSRIFVFRNLDNKVQADIFNNTKWDVDSDELNRSYQQSGKGAITNRYIDGKIDLSTVNSEGASLPNKDIYLFATNYISTITYSPNRIGMEYFALGSSNVGKEEKIDNIMKGTYTGSEVEYYLSKNPTATLKLDTTDFTLPSVYWFKIYKSSDFPEITTTKNYLCLWSTNHDTGAGGIWWGECDNLQLLNFVENGLIIDGDQSETPFLHREPNDSNGRKIYLYYHPDATHPDSGGYQQTRLLSCTGGVLHSATWTDEGKVLGIIDAPTTEQHTGYCQIYRLGASSLVATHTTKGVTGATASTIAKIGKSTSTDGKTWVRATSEFDRTSFMGFERHCHIDPGLYFNRAGKQYILCNTYDFLYTEGQARMGLALCAGNDFYPTRWLGEISNNDSGNGSHIVSGYVDTDTLHIYYVTGADDLYYTTFDLTQLD